MMGKAERDNRLLAQTISHLTDGTGLNTGAITAPKINSLPRNVIGLENMALSSINLFNKNGITTGHYILNDGTIASFASLAYSDYEPVIEGQIYTVSLGLSVMGGCYDVNRNWVKPIPSASGETSNYSFTVPLGIKYIRHNLYGGYKDTSMLINGAAMPSTYVQYQSKIELPWLKTSKWTGKNIGFIGDSNTEHGTHAAVYYDDYIKNKIDCNTYNYGIAGTGYTVYAGSSEIFRRIDGMAASLDLIISFAGLNDYLENGGHTFVMGAIGDAETASFYGAVESTVKRLITKYPTSTIMLITPIPYGANLWGTNTQGINQRQVADAIIDVGNHYSIPVLDLNRNSNLFPWNDTANEYYFKSPGASSGDRCHLNDAGHAHIGDMILAKINTL